MYPAEDNRTIKELCGEEMTAIVSSFIFERSRDIVYPFKVTSDANCAFCRKNKQIFLGENDYEHPEPTFIKRMPASIAALSYDQDYPGRSVVVLRDHVTEFNSLLKNKLILYLAFIEDVSAVVDAIETVCEPNRMNYAIYMNLHDHLHMHIIPRYEWEGDHFNGPPLFSGRSEMDPDFDYRSLALKIRKAINAHYKPSDLSKCVENMINDGLP